MLVVWEKHTEIRNEISAFNRRKESLTKTWESESRRINRRGIHMAIGADAWNRPLAREELLPVTTEARLMLRIFSNIGKRLITLAHQLPILRRKSVTRLASGAMLLGAV